MNDEQDLQLTREVGTMYTVAATLEVVTKNVSAPSPDQRRQWRLVDQVDYVITDSPLLLSSVYFDYYFNRSKQKLFSDKYRELAISYFDSTYYEFENIEVIIKRAKTFDPLGRNQTLDESMHIDEIIHNKVKSPNLVTNSQDSIVDTIQLIRTI